MRRGWVAAVLAVAALLASQEAHASIVFSYGVESCSSPLGDLDNYPFLQGGSGHDITAVTGAREKFCDHQASNRGASCTTNGDCPAGLCRTDLDNDCELKFITGVSQADDWVAVGSEYFAATDTIQAHFTIDANSINVNDGYETEVVRFNQTVGGKGCFLKAVTTGGGTYRLDMYYNDEDNECNGGTNDDTECTSCTTDAACGGSNVCYNKGVDNGACDNQCTALTAGEQWCLTSSIGSIGGLLSNRRYEIRLLQDNTAGTAHETKCSLWEGGFERSSRLDRQGACVGGASIGNACAADSECPSSTCSQSIIGTVNQVVFGASVAPNTAWQYKLDDFIIADDVTTSLAAVRIEDNVPDSTVTEEWTNNGDNCPSGGTSHWQAMDEANTTPGTDTNTSHCLSGTTLNTDKTDKYNFGATSSQAGDLASLPVLVVGSYAVMQDNATGGGQSVQGCQTCIERTVGSTTTTCGRSDNLATESVWVPCGLNVVNASTTLDALTEVDGARVHLVADNSSCTTSCGSDASTVVVESLIGKTLPVKPGVAKDVNLDGVKHFRLTGDSVVSQAGFHERMLGGLEDFDVVSFCTRGSQSLKPIELQAVAMMNGDVGGTMNCRYFKGAAAPADYLGVVAGANTFGYLPQLVPRKYCNAGTSIGDTCSVDGDCPSGKCQKYELGYCRGGTDHGKPCVAPVVTTQYCANFANAMESPFASRWLAPVFDATCGNCSVDTDCDANIPCTTNGDCPAGATSCTSSRCRGDCISAKCSSTNSDAGFLDGGTMQPGAGGIKWALAGSIDVPGCSGGLCWAQNTIAEAARSIRVLLDTAEARTATGTSCSECTGGSNAGLTCQVAGDCPGGTCNAPCKVELLIGVQPEGQRYDAAGDVYVASAKQLDSAGTLFREMARAAGAYYVDIAACFRRDCANKNAVNCHNDEIHWNNDGFAKAFGCFEACLENRYGHHDGVCDDNVCTSGKTGAACVTDEACNTYSCAIAAPPLSWTASHVALWALDEVSTGSAAVTALNTGTMSTDCNLTDKNNDAAANYVARVTSAFREGTRSANPGATGSHAEYFETTSTACIGTIGSETGTGKHKTWQQWMRASQTAVQTTISHYTGTSGYKLELNSTNKAVCTFGDGTAARSATSTTTITSSGPWFHVACVYDDTAGNVTVYVNGVAQATSTGSFDMLTAGTGTPFRIGGTSTADEYRGNWDEAAIANKALSALQVCREASCKINGSAAGICVCNADDLTKYVSTGLYATDLNGCGQALTPTDAPPGLPACNASAP